MSALTEYVVLIRLVGDEDLPPVPEWREVKRVEAASAEAAVRATAGDVDGEYVATPTRSWQPVQVKVETKLVLKLGTGE